ncbi:uncharacterized protein LOC130787253 [Actinidia eriantha]|uniref:uncharacterized protein LOC130787253 n=1 Tax=Actinidia eriantha TaxID=165200 RepID=UPI00258CAB52|nr:uncharacterized protein LOC130787253 [Actinidia eriantha]
MLYIQKFPGKFPDPLMLFIQYFPGKLPSVKSPVDSVVGSTEKKTDSLAGLTRELARSSLQEKTQNIKVASPPATALGGKIQSRDVDYAAVEQAVRLKMNGEGPPKGMRLLGPHRNLSFVRYPTPPAKNTDIGFYANEGLS